MRLLPLVLALALTGCASLTTPTALVIRPTTVSEFLENPFGHDESVASYKLNLPKCTLAQRLIHRHNPTQRPDTIYNFKFRRSKIAVFKSLYGQEFVMGGNVLNRQIELMNGVRTGITRSEFNGAFSDLPMSLGDTIRLVHPTTGRTFGFIFNRKGQLYRYTFSGTKSSTGAGVTD